MSKKKSAQEKSNQEKSNQEKSGHKKTAQKLGRNPLDSIQKFADQPLGPATHFALHGQDKPRQKGGVQTYVEKVKEMRIQVDWAEVYRSTLGLQVKKLSKFFSIS